MDIKTDAVGGGRECLCSWDHDTGYFEPCCEAHEQEYVKYLKSTALSDQHGAEAAGSDKPKG